MVQLFDEEPEPQAVKAQKAWEKAVSLYPLETWREIEQRIFIASTRDPKSNNQKRNFEKELIQARILTVQGSTVYFLPEKGEDKHPDAVVDGFIIEFKTVTGNRNRIEEHFRSSRKKADTVFFKINSLLSKDEVIKKLEGTIIQGDYHGGRIIVYFTETGKLYYWNVDDLR
jgi:hypothetical protein